MFALYLVKFFESNCFMRLDKWIWAVRMIKTRSQATQACKLGKVFLNGQKTVKAAKAIKVGDIIEVETAKRGRLKYQVDGFVQKQSGEAAVAKFFTDLSPVIEEEQETEIVPGYKKRAPKKRYRKDQGKVTKKERRRLDAFKENW
jgi:ribosome-associated heat shock protein Hsp15